MPIERVRRWPGLAEQARCGPESRRAPAKAAAAMARKGSVGPAAFEQGDHDDPDRRIFR